MVVLTIIEGKLLGRILVKHEGEYLLAEVLLAVLPVLAAVHEDVELPGVRVQVAVEGDAALLLQLAYHLLDVVDRREGLLDHRLVLPVEVAAGEGAPRVAHDDAVGVQHRDDLRSEYRQRLGIYSCSIQQKIHCCIRGHVSKLVKGKNE